jgi:hypothetical protein
LEGEEPGMTARTGSTTIISNRFWRRLTWLIRLDMAAGLVLAAGLLLWLQWN